MSLKQTEKLSEKKGKWPGIPLVLFSVFASLFNPTAYSQLWHSGADNWRLVAHTIWWRPGGKILLWSTHQMALPSPEDMKALAPMLKLSLGALLLPSELLFDACFDHCFCPVRSVFPVWFHWSVCQQIDFLIKCVIISFHNQLHFSPKHFFGGVFFLGFFFEA